MRRQPLTLWAAPLAGLLARLPAAAQDLKISTSWLGGLARDARLPGAAPRTQADLARQADYPRGLAADIIAVQSVDSPDLLRSVFGADCGIHLDRRTDALDPRVMAYMCVSVAPARRHTATRLQDITGHALMDTQVVATAQNSLLTGCEDGCPHCLQGTNWFVASPPIPRIQSVVARDGPAPSVAVPRCTNVASARAGPANAWTRRPRISRPSRSRAVPVP